MTINVRDYGAVGDGLTDDRAAIQAAIDAAAAVGDEVLIPSSATSYVVDRSGTNAYCLNIPSNVRLRGTGVSSSVLIQISGIATGVVLLHVEGDDISIRDVCLDGNKATQSMDTTRAGMFVESSALLSVTNVAAQNFTGNGFTLSTGVTDPFLENCVATNNNQHGLEIAAMSGLRLINCQLTDNAVRQFESNATAPITDISMLGCRFAGGTSTDYVLNTAGPSTVVHNAGWSISSCTIDGPVKIANIDDLSIIGCHGVNPTGTPTIDIQQQPIGVEITGNSFYMTQDLTDAVAVISIVGSGTGQAAIDVTISGNRIDSKGRAKAYGILASGCISVTIVNNVIDGPGLVQVGWTGGIAIVATNASEDFRSCIVRGNTISNWPQIGIGVSGNTSAKLLALDVSHNVFDDHTGVMRYAMSLDDPSNPTGAAQRATVIGNQCVGGVCNPIYVYPACPVLVSGDLGASGIYSVLGTPQGALAESVGAIAYRRDGGAGSTLYVKESGAGTNTGWVAK